jgi:alkylation response protein AidB-like acyl-CoA dehydrogenase
MVEKFKRDVRITTIYEGTSEIMEMTIGRDRWQQHLKTRGRYYLDAADQLDALHATNPNLGANVAAMASRALAGVMETARVHRLTRNQHLLFRIGELVAFVECAGSFARRAAAAGTGDLVDKAEGTFDGTELAAMSRVYAREAASKVALEGTRWVLGAAEPGAVAPAELAALAGTDAIAAAQAGLLADMDTVAAAINSHATTA